MSLDELTITLSDKDGRVSVDTLINSLENALEMLRGIEATLIKSGVHVRWEVIRVRMRSPLRMTFSPIVRRSDGKGRPNKTIAKKLVKVAIDGIANIEKGTALSPHFSPDSIEATRRLVKTATKDGGSLAFESPSASKVQLTEKSVKHIDDLVAKARHYIDFSTVEGRLDVVSVHEHNTFTIWETLTNHRIECFVSESQVKEASNLLGKRVAVTGRVSYKDHVPQKVHVEGEIRVLRSSSELPQPQDIGPIDITGGASSEEHVWRLRNA